MSGRHCSPAAVTLPDELIDGVRDVCMRHRLIFTTLNLETLVKVIAKEVGRSLGRSEYTYAEICEALAELNAHNKLAIPIPQK